MGITTSRSIVEAEESLVRSRYLNIIKHEKRKIAFHSLVGNPVFIDDDVGRLLEELQNPFTPEDLRGRSDDFISAIKDLRGLGFLLPEKDLPQEYQRWKEKLHREHAAEPLFSGGIVFLLTTRCNLNCNYCICAHSLKGKVDMTTRTARKILDWYLPYLLRQDRSARPYFIFTGGEPLLQISLLREITDHIESSLPQDQPRFRVISNGTLITRQISEYFEKHEVDLIISADVNEATHNRHRPYINGAASWKKIWDAIALFSKSYRATHLSISSVYHGDHSFESGEQLLEKMAEHGIYYHTLNVDNLAVLKDPEETAGRIISLRKAASEKYDIVVSGRWAVPAATLRSGKKFSSTCSASGRSRIFFQPDGSVTFCDYDHRKLGSIEEIEAYFNRADKERKRYFLGNWKECEECMLAGFCSPCVLEKEVLHPVDPDFQRKKCLFVKECTRLLMFE